MEFRCANTLHFKKVGADLIEIKCRAKRCGAGNGNVILHRYKFSTGELVQTLAFKDPKAVFDNGLNEQAKTDPTKVLFSSQPSQKEAHHGSRRSGHSSAVRSA